MPKASPPRAEAKRDLGPFVRRIRQAGRYLRVSHPTTPDQIQVFRLEAMNIISEYGDRSEWTVFDRLWTNTFAPDNPARVKTNHYDNPEFASWVDPQSGHKALKLLFRVARRMAKEVKRTYFLDPPPSTHADLAPMVVESVETTRLRQVNEFVERVWQETERKINKTDIWRLAMHKTARQFERWQRGDDKATKSDNKNFPRILEMAPEEFVQKLDLLRKSPRA